MLFFFTSMIITGFDEMAIAILVEDLPAKIKMFSVIYKNDKFVLCIRDKNR